MAIPSFDMLMQGFGVVTVMNACIFELNPDASYTATKNCKTVIGENGSYNVTNAGLSANSWHAAGEYIDTLKIANLTQEGPTKTVTGGQYANPLIKYGKTMTCEMQDALGRASTLVRFFGCEYNGGVLLKTGAKFNSNVMYGDGKTTVFYAFTDKFPTQADYTANQAGLALKDTTGGTLAWDETTKGVKVTFTTAPTEGDVFYVALEVKADVAQEGSRLSVTDKFPGPFAIEGDTFFIDQKTGEKKHVFILIPQFIPDAILTLTQDAEGDATVFDLNGTLGVTTITENGESRDIFYEIRETSFFAEQRRALP